MTLENSKKLYDALMAVGRVKEAEAIAKGRPEVLGKPKTAEKIEKNKKD